MKGYYNYHGKISQRIEAGELVFCRFGNHKRFGECLILHFVTEPKTRPIRPHRYGEYREVIDNYLQK